MKKLLLLLIVLVLVFQVSAQWSPRAKCLLPSACTLGSGFGCSEAKAIEEEGGQGTIQLTIRNILGVDLDSVAVYFEGDNSLCADIGPVGSCDDSVATSCIPSGEDGGYDWEVVQADCSAEGGCDISAANVVNGKDMFHIRFGGCDFSQSDPIDMDFHIVYVKAGESVNHTIEGHFRDSVPTRSEQGISQGLLFLIETLGFFILVVISFFIIRKNKYQILQPSLAKFIGALILLAPIRLIAIFSHITDCPPPVITSIFPSILSFVTWFAGFLVAYILLCLIWRFRVLRILLLVLVAILVFGFLFVAYFGVW